MTDGPSKLPSGWKWVRLGEAVNDVFSGGTPSTKKSEHWGGSIPWITSAGKHGCLVCVAYSLLHLTCLPAVPDRTKGLIQTMGDTCRQQGRALLQRLLGFVHDQLSQGLTADRVFAQLFAKQRGLIPV